MRLIKMGLKWHDKVNILGWSTNKSSSYMYINKQPAGKGLDDISTSLLIFYDLFDFEFSWYYMQGI